MGDVRPGLSGVAGATATNRAVGGSGVWPPLLLPSTVAAGARLAFLGVHRLGRGSSSKPVRHRRQDVLFHDPAAAAVVGRAAKGIVGPAVRRGWPTVPRHPPTLS